MSAPDRTAAWLASAWCALALFLLLTVSGIAHAEQPNGETSISGWRQAEVVLNRAKATMPVSPAAVLTMIKPVEAFAFAQQPSGRQRQLMAKVRWLGGAAQLRLEHPERAKPLIESGLALVAGEGDIKL
ncbi:MAG: hypothetical protein ACTHMG_06365, partial [Sphingomonas sp.]